MTDFRKNERGQSGETVVSRFEDFRGRNLSEEDLSNTPIDVLQTIEFDTETAWPSEGKMPKGFDPEKLLERCKNPGLGIEELHEQGITGQGVVVAIIDQKLDGGHPEYKDSIIGYREYDGAENEAISMHGPAVASLLVGKDCGVAPGVKLVYKAVPSGRDFLPKAHALTDIIEGNRNVPQKDKVRIVSCSIDYVKENPEPGLSEWIAALDRAKEEGILVVDVGGNQIGVSFSGGGSPEGKDNFESYLSWLRYDEGDEELNRIISEGNVDEILKKLREVRKDELEKYPAMDWRKKIEEDIKQRKREIVVPSDYRTMASSWSKEGQYMYNGRGGISWSVPYLAGLFAMILQVNPDIKREEISKIINESAVTNKKGVRVVNPKGIIDLAKKSLKK